jgi:hypothetical protein
MLNRCTYFADKKKKQKKLGMYMSVIINKCWQKLQLLNLL